MYALRRLHRSREGHNSRRHRAAQRADPQNPGNGASQVADMFPNFPDTYFPEEIRENNNYETPGSWLQAIGPLRRRHSLLDLALSALSMVRLGRNRGNEQLQREGVAKYGRVLKDLQNILASDSLALEEQIWRVA